MKREVEEEINGGFKVEYRRLHDYALKLKYVDDYTIVQVFGG